MHRCLMLITAWFDIVVGYFQGYYIQIEQWDGIQI